MKLKTKIYNNSMYNGKKEIFEKILKRSIKFFQKSNKKSHGKVLKKSIINSMPIIKMCKVKSKNKKKIKEFPYIVNKKIRISLGIKSIFKKKLDSTKQNLFKEMILVSKKKSDILKTKEANHKTTITYKKSAFFRWFF